MSSAYNHMKRFHRSERYKPGHAGGRNFSRSKYHRVRSVRPGLLAGLMGAIRTALFRHAGKKAKGGAKNAAEEL